ncbi:MAG: DUF1592 domain-containing protein [Myxococcota bacterium]
MRSAIGTSLLLLACQGSIVGDEPGAGLDPRVGVDPEAPGDVAPPTADECVGAAADAAPARWRRLTRRQYALAVADLFGVSPNLASFVADGSAGDSPFAANVGFHVQESQVDAYWNVAANVADAVDLEGLLGCAPDVACVRDFVVQTGRRAYRRALRPDEVDRLVALYELGADESPDEGVRTVLQAMMQSPNFLYLQEYGFEGDAVDQPADQLYALDGYAVAGRLSFLLWNTVPDDALLDAAEAGELDSADGIARHAERLMDDARFVQTLVDFHMDVTLASQIDDVSRDEPEFTDALRNAMHAEVEDYIRLVLADGGTIVDLFTTPVPMDQPGLDVIYGDEPGVRRGILTLPGILAAKPKIETNYAPTYRGNAIRLGLLCDPTPPIQVDIVFEDAGGLTARELLRQHQENPGCVVCHERMDPLGFPFENYDDLGRWRTTAQGEAIDATGNVLVVEPGENGEPEERTNHPVDGPVELGEVLADLDQVRACFATQWFRYALARNPGARDGCSMRTVIDRFTEGEGNVRDAILALVQSDSFRMRRGQP